MRPECEDCKHCKYKPTEDPSIGGAECEYDETPTIDHDNDWCDGWEFRDAWSE